MHAEPQGDGDGGEESAELTVDEVQVIQGALDMASKTAADAMTPIEKVWLPLGLVGWVVGGEASGGLEPALPSSSLRR